MTALAPICHIPPEDIKTQPQPVALPSIPLAQANLQSLTHTVNQMRLVLNFITGRQGPQGPQGQAGSPAKPPKPPRWSEAGRQTETVRVFQNNDKTSDNWIDVERINQLKMTDAVTGEGWTWDRERK